MTDAMTADDRPFDSWWVPRQVQVRRIGSVRLLEWKFADASDPTVTASRETLEAFLNLAGAADDAFEDYARRWGVLSVCWHRRSDSRSEEHGWHLLTAAAVLDRFAPSRKADPPLPPGWVESDPQREGVRAIDSWELLARRLAAALRLWRELDDGSAGAVTDWTTLWDSSRAGRFMLTRPQQERRWFFDRLLATWQDDAHLPVSPAPMSKPTRLIGHPAGLDGGLLAMVIDAGLARARVQRCDACKRLYLREGRAPRAGERNYCADDRQRGPWRFAQAARRADMSEEERVKYRQSEAKRKRDAREASRQRRETRNGA
jgi:hypothetical protein